MEMRWEERAGCEAMEKKAITPPPGDHSNCGGMPSFQDQFTKASPGLREVKTACVYTYVCVRTWTSYVYISYNAYTYIYTHTRCFRPVVGLIYSDIVSANGNLSPENPPHIRSYTLYCCVQNAAAAVVLCPTLLHYYIDCSKQHRIELDSTDPVKITFSPKLRKSNKFLNIFFPMETIE